MRGPGRASSGGQVEPSMCGDQGGGGGSVRAEVRLVAALLVRMTLSLVLAGRQRWGQAPRVALSSPQPAGQTSSYGCAA